MDTTGDKNNSKKKNYEPIKRGRIFMKLFLMVSFTVGICSLIFLINQSIVCDQWDTSNSRDLGNVAITISILTGIYFLSYFVLPLRNIDDCCDGMFTVLTKGVNFVILILLIIIMAEAPKLFRNNNCTGSYENSGYLIGLFVLTPIFFVTNFLLLFDCILWECLCAIGRFCMNYPKEFKEVYACC